jgi:hypothetical protein
MATKVSDCPQARHHATGVDRARYCDGLGRQALEPHPCPYQEEINDDSESLCECCEACAYECAMDI